MPEGWAGRRIALAADYVNSIAMVFVDGKHAGEIRFPGGELDITAMCSPGKKHVLSMLVVAVPLSAVMLSYTDTAAAREVRGTVPRRGLCGDVYCGNACGRPDRPGESGHLGAQGADLVRHVARGALAERMLTRCAPAFATTDAR